ncbi:CAP domain-containing protein [Fontibacillus panacisegetis]|nr:CAP domain-containing protein [Fontibacillus panacisegetis]
MKNVSKKLAIVGAIALSPVLAAGPTMAASLNATDQAATKAYVAKVQWSGHNFNLSQQNNSLSGQSLSDLLNKLLNNSNNNNASKPTSPAPSKSETITEDTNAGKGETQKNTTSQDENNKSEFAKQVVDLVNQERAKAGLQPLKSDAALTNVAMIKAKDMYNNNYFDHNSPTLGSPFDLMKSEGIQYRTAGENIAKGQRTPQEVMNAWMNSEGHRQNIMNANYTSIGVAYYNGEWVQEFTG